MEAVQLTAGLALIGRCWKNRSQLVFNVQAVRGSQACDVNAKDPTQFTYSTVKDPARVVTLTGTELNNAVVIGLYGSEKLSACGAHCAKTES